MIVVKDIECPKCGIKEVSIESGIRDCRCECGLMAHVLPCAPRVVGADSFNPHFDQQLGKHFDTAEEKKTFLRETGRDQVGGPPSPRKSNKSNIICTKEQAKREFGRA